MSLPAKNPFPLTLPPYTALAISVPPLEPQLNYLTQIEIDTANKIRHPQRKNSYITGRIAAHKALEILGAPSSLPIKSDPDGLPLWPQDITGSISHTEDIGTALVAFENRYQIVGIDIEKLDRAIPPSLINRIGTRKELEALNAIFPSAPQNEKTILLFSAKETIFKGVFNCTRHRIFLKDCRLSEAVSQHQLNFLVNIAGKEEKIKVLCSQWKNIVITAVLDALKVQY